MTHAASAELLRSSLKQLHRAARARTASLDALRYVVDEYLLLSPDDRMLFRPEKVVESGWLDLITANPTPANKDEKAAASQAFALARTSLRDVPRILQQGDISAASAHSLIHLLAHDLRGAWNSVANRPEASDDPHADQAGQVEALDWFMRLANVLLTGYDASRLGAELSLEYALALRECPAVGPQERVPASEAYEPGPAGTIAPAAGPDVEVAAGSTPLGKPPAVLPPAVPLPAITPPPPPKPPQPSPELNWEATAIALLAGTTPTPSLAKLHLMLCAQGYKGTRPALYKMKQLTTLAAKLGVYSPKAGKGQYGTHGSKGRDGLVEAWADKETA